VCCGLGSRGPVSKMYFRSIRRTLHCTRRPRFHRQQGNRNACAQEAVEPRAQGDTCTGKPQPYIPKRRVFARHHSKPEDRFVGYGSSHQPCGWLTPDTLRKRSMEDWLVRVSVKARAVRGRLFTGREGRLCDCDIVFIEDLLGCLDVWMSLRIPSGWKGFSGGPCLA